MLQGTFSHEPPGTLDLFSLIGGKFPVYVAEQIEQVALLQDGSWLSSLCGENGDWRFEHVPEQAVALFSCLPAINKASLVAAVGHSEAEFMGDVVADLLSGFGDINQQARNDKIPAMAVSHGTVSGCMTEHGVPMLGLDHEFTVGSLFAAKASAFLLGHIHKHQAWEKELPGYGTQRAAYAGSIGRLHYGEEGDKGWLFWDVDWRNASCVLMPTPSRRLIHLDFDGIPDMDAVRAAAISAQGAFVRVRYSVDEEHRHEVDREAIQHILENAGAAAVKTEGRVIPVIRVRAEGISKANSLDEKLQKWAETTSVEFSPLQQRLHQLTTQEPEAILDGLLHKPSAPTVITVKSAPETL